MEKYEFLDTLQGKQARFFYHFRNKRINLEYPQNYLVKKGKGKETECAIINETISQMQKFKRTSFKSDIACHIKINSSNNNLAETYHLTKNFFDLLSRSWVEKRYNSKTFKLHRLPYIDDKQIAYFSIDFSPIYEKKDAYSIN